MRGSWRPVRLLCLAVMAMLVGCSGGADTRSGPEPTDTDITAERCLVRVHGRSETGAEPVEHADHVELSPTGNDTSGEGHQWLYDTDEHRDEAMGRVQAWIDRVQCTDVVLYGFSNGAAFVASTYCGGESFDDRLRGVVIDDPVTDEAVIDCEPPEGVPAALYWTGSLTEAQPGVLCDDIGYTCSGDLILGVDAYADELGVDVQASPHTDHTAFQDAPELLEWLVDSPA